MHKESASDRAIERQKQRLEERQKENKETFLLLLLSQNDRHENSVSRINKSQQKTVRCSLQYNSKSARTYLTVIGEGKPSFFSTQPLYCLGCTETGRIGPKGQGGDFSGAIQSVKNAFNLETEEIAQTLKSERDRDKSTEKERERGTCIKYGTISLFSFCLLSLSQRIFVQSRAHAFIQNAVSTQRERDRERERVECVCLSVRMQRFT